MCTYKKVGTFTRFKIPGRKRKLAIKSGGNVATYFCTPDGRVIHAVAGNVTADFLHKEATWARDLYRRAFKEAKGDMDHLTAIVRAAHKQAVGRRYPSPVTRSRHRIVPVSRPHLVHRELAVGALMPLAKVFPRVWTRILGERVSDAPVKEADLVIRRCGRVRGPRLGTLLQAKPFVIKTKKGR